jgi:uncharacterized membrane protein YkvA (DUF1232 family)
MLNKIKAKAKELKYDLSALYLAYKRKDVPVLAKIFIIMAIGYALSPIDLIPGFIPVIGFLDDLLIVPLLVIVSVKFIPKHIMDECREQSRDMWKNGKPKKWFYALPVILIWLLIICIIAKKLMSGKQ